MFINLSNHPSSGWSLEQLKAAKKYGEGIDLAFPNIEPSFTSKDVNELADVTAEGILEIDAHAVVHIMGEMTFTFMVVTRLKEMGIKCIASTTERKTTYNDDGTKLSEFSFVKFREY